MTAEERKLKFDVTAADEAAEAERANVTAVEPSGTTAQMAPKTSMPIVQEPSLFGTLKQGTLTNDFAKMKASKENTVIDAVGKATITHGTLSAFIEKYVDTVGLRQSTKILFDVIVETLTESTTKDIKIVIPLSTYMSLRGLKNRQETKNQVSEDIEVLGAMSWVLRKQTKSGNIKSTDIINLAQRARVSENSEIIFHFSEDFAKYILSLSTMPMPKELYKINTHRNPSSYIFGRKAAEHKFMNTDKSNENIISVHTLLKSSPYLPTAEQVMSTNRNYTDRITIPFERDMNALSDLFSWEYCKKHGEPLTEEENELLYSSKGRSLFESLNVKLQWHAYPDQTARIERKKQARDAAIRRNTKRITKSKAPQPAQVTTIQLFTVK